MSSVTCIIDGREVTAPEGTMLLKAAREAGIEIPSLCHDDRLEPSGACRLCMVEITKNGRRRLVASCCYPVEDGLEVRTDTEELLKIRRMIIELLWPSLEGLGKKYGVTQSRFKPSHTDCSMCGLCVRYCAEITKRHAVYFAGRGVDREIALVPEMAAQCMYCGECFNLCSGGWIVNEMNNIYA
ncbi:(2Fe-2S)-binding protein [bacterium]|nr:(2Fe-2S)-binding protein [candidate division CSSED10-310 bacterium]